MCLCNPDNDRYLTTSPRVRTWRVWRSTWSRLSTNPDPFRTLERIFRQGKWCMVLHVWICREVFDWRSLTTRQCSSRGNISIKIWGDLQNIFLFLFLLQLFYIYIYIYIYMTLAYYYNIRITHPNQLKYKWSYLHKTI